MKRQAPNRARSSPLLTALDKELRAVARQEAKLLRPEAGDSPWKSGVENKIPPKLRQSLESAFCKAFSMVLGPGRRVIEKSYHKNSRLKDYCIRNYAVELKGERRELRRMHWTVRKNGLRNLVLTTAEGAGLGVLGIGLPDIVLFLGVLLKGIYETALDYGFDYETPSSQLLICKMMEAALSHGERQQTLERQVETLLTESPQEIRADVLQAQIQSTASAFASDMLLLKFVQGLPLIGIMGGMGNPLYYHRILRYVQLKYRKRYLLRCRKRCLERMARSGASYPDPAGKAESEKKRKG